MIWFTNTVMSEVKHLGLRKMWLAWNPGEIIKSAVYDHSGDIGGLLTQGMRKVAEELGK